ncbi:MAG: type II toxin-antitoxin system RelE/ParE family toxin [Chthoniobacter sp.]
MKSGATLAPSMCVPMTAGLTWSKSVSGLLSLNSRAGQARPDIAPELRFLPVGNYLIFHRPIENGVEIVRVLHGSRDYRSEFA